MKHPLGPFLAPRIQKTIRDVAGATSHQLAARMCGLVHSRSATTSRMRRFLRTFAFRPTRAWERHEDDLRSLRRRQAAMPMSPPPKSAMLAGSGW